MASLLINYAEAGQLRAQKLNTTTGLLIGGFERAISFGPDDLDAEFVARNRDILHEPIGGGNWLWRPYVIMKALREALSEGDILF